MRIILFAIAIALAADAGVSDEPRAVPGALAAEVAQAVKDLGAPEFEKRQAASELLWRTGEAAIEPLEQASKSTDPEVRTRATTILAKVRLGIRPDTPPDIVASIDQVRLAASSAEGQQALRQLLAKGESKTVLALLRLEQNPEHRRSIASAISPLVSQLVRPLIENAELNQAEDVLNLVSASDDGLTQLIAFLILTGRIDERVSDLQRRSNMQPKDEEQVRLAYLLRAKGDLPAALDAAQRSTNLILRTKLLAEARQWREAAELSDSYHQQHPKRLESAAFAATCFRLAGDLENHDRVMNAILKAANVEWLKGLSLEPGAANPGPPPSNDIVAELMAAAVALLVNERIDEAQAILRKISPQFAHIIYWRQHRHQEALELAKVTPDKTLDEAWLKELLPPPPLQPKEDFSFTLAAQVARQLRDLGRSEQVEQIWKTLSAMEVAEKERGPRAAALAQLAWQLRRESDAWDEAAKAVEAKIAPAMILGQFAGKEASLALAWHERFVLQGWDQARAISTAVRMVARDPRRTGPPDNWRDVVAEARESLKALAPPSRAARLVAFGHTCKIRGDEQLAREIFQEAAGINPAHGMEWGDCLATDGKWEDAAQCYAAAVKANPANPVVRYLWGHALGKLGDAPAAQRQRFLATTAVLAPEQRYGFIKSMTRFDLKEDALEQFDLVRRTALPDSRIGVTAGQEIGNIVSTNEPQRSAEYWRLLLLHMLNTSAVFPQAEAYPLLSHVIHRVSARAAIQAGDAQAVAKELERCEALAPADIKTVLTLTTLLRRSGMDAIADGMLEQALALHRGLLESFPSSAMYWNNAAWLCARTQRKLDEALALAEKAVALAPDEAAYQDTLAEVHFQRGDRQAAVAAAKKCVAIVPENQMFAKRLKHFETDELKTLDKMEDD